MKVKGLFYFHDMDGLTFFRLYSDKKVISYGRYARFDQSLHEFPWFQIESDKVY